MPVSERVVTWVGAIGSTGVFAIAFFFIMCLAILRHLGFIGAEIDRRLAIEMLISQLHSELDHLETHLYQGKSFGWPPAQYATWEGAKRARLMALQRKIDEWERELEKVKTRGTRSNSKPR